MSHKRTASVASIEPDEFDADRIVPLGDGAADRFAFSSVVKVFVVASRPNYILPWQMNRQDACSGSGFIIAKRRILTNAHVVRDYTTVRVRRHGGSDKFRADVLCINHECDLALLSVQDDGFWTGLPELEIAPSIPQLYENVMVVGYPMGGDTVCVTRGVVSRVTVLPYEEQKYHLVTPELLAIQIDAAINSGNSGGPVIHESGAVVGVAFSGYAGSADNIGYIIPYPVIKNFLDGFDRFGETQHICNLGFTYMLCENPAMRAKLKLKAPDSGILIIKVAPLGAAAKGGIESGDIIMEMNGTKIASDGTVDFRSHERLKFIHLVTIHPAGEPLKCVILRKGKRKTLNVIGATTPSILEMHRVVGVPASYYIVGGVVFVPVTVGLLDVAVENLGEEAWQACRAPKKFEDQEVVVIISILAHAINHGYTSGRIAMLKEVNGTEVKNMRHLKEQVEKVKSGFLDFTLATGRKIILDASECFETEEEILKTYAIPAGCSPDLRGALAATNGATPRAKGKGKAGANGKTAAASKRASRQPASAKPVSKRPRKPRS